MEERGLAAPAVSVVMPVRNEVRHLAAAVRRVLDQDYDGAIEVVLGVAPSRDGTEAVVDQLCSADRRVRAVPNPAATTPAGLNAAIRAARHDIVVRLDGHSVPPVDYVRAAVALLQETGAANVGGVMAAEGESAFEQAVARAMRSRFGVGSAAFHTGGEAGPADTVYLGVFRRAMLVQLGGYDESYERAQDWELNYRIRQAGGLVWFSPSLVVTYRPRSDLSALSRQYFHYGRWRRVLIGRYPNSVTVRYLAPPAAVVGVVAGLLLALGGWPLGLAGPAGYLGVLLSGSAVTGRGLPLAARVRLPLVYAAMHGSWGLGFLTSRARLARTGPALQPAGSHP